METVFLLLVAVLVLLAISDLVVGVSNDAVNFLNSAIGSKSAPFWIIMIIASAGIMFGATFSEGMMEVARKSIFHPEMFGFNEIMIIFLAVMLTDIILLDTFNTLGLPTSTTVSIVFELLGAAVAISIIKISNTEGGPGIDAYINSGKALLIIAGILLSVVVAFTVGSLIQFLIRILFSFNYTKSYKYFGALWGGIAIAAITYFILIKGAKGASFMSSDTKDFIKQNTIVILGLSFVFWTVLLGILQFAAKVNILKVIVLVGTFALAMAFAGNDLVNFIGVPLAGLKSHALWSGSGISPDGFSMELLAEKVKTPTLYLLIAGIVMVITLWVSKKARSVTATELNLSKQDRGYEQFESNAFARFVVRQSLKVSKALSFIIPEKFSKAIEQRFVPKVKEDDDTNSAFDLVRASVNLTVASILISFATSYKLPLSTTYVTFMVAMGTSLADGAWGRESAVYRVSGVATVIGGWFFTAFIAFTAAFIVALLISWTQFYAVPVLLGIGVYVLIKSKQAHKGREEEDAKVLNFEKEEQDDIDIKERCLINVINTVSNASELYGKTFDFIEKEDRKKLKKLNKEVNKLNKKTKSLKDGVDAVIVELQEDSIETGHYYVQVLDYLREVAHSLSFITEPIFEHFDNQHSGFNKDQNSELAEMNKQIQVLLKSILNSIKKNDFSNLDEQLKTQQSILDLLQATRKKQIKRIKNAEVGTKNSILFLAIVSETKNFVLFMINLLKAQRDFVIYQNNGLTTEEVVLQE
jgi:phosphate/sulfate permease